MHYIIILLITTISLTAASSARKKIDAQLNTTIVPKIDNLQTLNINELMNVLSKFSNNKINFLYFPPKPPPKITVPAIPPYNLPLNGFDPNNNGVPLPPPPSFGQGQTNFFMPPMEVAVEQKVPEMKIATGQLNNLTMKQLVNIIAMGCQPPIKYIITDYGVVFLPREKDKPYIETRSFRMNGGFFRNFNRGRNNTPNETPPSRR